MKFAAKSIESLLVKLLAAVFLQTSLFAQTGTLVVLNKTDNTASLIDCSTKVTRVTIPTGVGPHEVSVSHDGKLAVVSNYGVREKPGHSLTVIDIPAKKTVKEINLGEYSSPHGVVFFSDGKRVAVTVERSKMLLVVNIESGRVEQAIPTDQEVSHMVALTPDNNRAFVANIGSGSVTAIDLKSGSRVTSVKTGDGAEGIDISPDGKEVWVTNRAANSVTVIQSQNLSVSETLVSKDFPIRTKFTPDGTYALVSNARSGEVALFEVSTRKEIRRLKMELSVVNDVDKRLFGNQFGSSPTPIGILVLPTGSHAYIANSNADLVTVIDLKEWKIVDRIKTGKEPDGLGYSRIVLN
ncbi:MAG: YncE family protein [Bacteroidota bacterium]